jgi:Acetyltransferases
MKAGIQDLPEILALQYLAYQSEAKLLDNPNIQPLTQTLQQIQQEYEKSVFLKAADENDAIIGSVRAYSQNGTVYIGKLIVHPGFQGRGIGTKLLSEIERAYPQKRYELFTGSKSIRNIRLYERLGYVIFKEQRISDGLSLVYMQKVKPAL